ncbi:MAG: selenocysteine synthase, partial [Acidobacteria bacterium]|nr:selenocysteine synthase [Acidobacteriota bacterium]
MSDRRSFLQTLAGLPVVSGLAPARRDYLKELGVRPFLNAAGTYTMLTASLMPPEVVGAIEYCSKHYVRLNELHEAVGRRIAELIGCEAAMVTAGAASALTVGTAVCMTGKNQEFIRRLPDTTGMKSEAIIQKSHRYGYDHAVRACGVRFVEVETREELERTAGPSTALMLFFNDA